MSNDLEPVTRDVLYEQACEAYFEILDERGKHPNTKAMVTRLLAKHPDYPPEETLSLLKTPEFNQLLQDRRKRYLIDRACIALYAAERGAAMQESLFDRIQATIEGGEAKLKDLIDAARFLVDLEKKAGGVVEEVTGSDKLTVNIHFKNLLSGLPAERRAAVIAEVMRANSAPVLEIEDAERK